MTKIGKGLFIFHRDLRIQDNRGLWEASRRCKHLYVCFIFTPEQVGRANKYRSNDAIQFMIESLEELSADIASKGSKLLIFYGNPVAVLRGVLKHLPLEGVFFNQDYSPYAVKRDQAVANLCEKQGIECRMFSDYYLYEPGTILSGKEAYKKYTPFYERVLPESVETPKGGFIGNLAQPDATLPNTLSLGKAKEHFVRENAHILVRGGRKHALVRLRTALREQHDYDETRDFFMSNTTFLSAYIKFGCVSIREVYHAFLKRFGKHHGLIRELIWREFFAHVLYAYPEVVGQSYQERYRRLDWSNSAPRFHAWCEGRTGFPLVDACMRQLNLTGYMHNRGRMTVASFLIKTLLIDWRWGERYFAQKLTDYDIASNNGNWQGISGTGVDMKPYFRDMNPWIQSRKYDADTEFIKKWVPELQDVDPIDIHQWYIAHERPEYKAVKYPRPMVDYYAQKEKMLRMYQDA